MVGLVTAVAAAWLVGAATVAAPPVPKVQSSAEAAGRRWAGGAAQAASASTSARATQVKYLLDLNIGSPPGSFLFQILNDW